MRIKLIAPIVVLAAAAAPATGVKSDDGAAFGSGVWQSSSLVAFEVSHAQGSVASCIPEDPACRSYGALAIVGDPGSWTQGLVRCVRISGTEVFMAVAWGDDGTHDRSHPSVDQSAAYAVVNDAGEAAFSFKQYAGSPCDNVGLQQALRESASPLLGGAVAIFPCDVLVCNYT